MRIWLIGADRTGVSVLQQLKKSQAIEVVVSDVSERPRAVADKVIPMVDYVETVTPININHLAKRIRPDLILIDRGAAERMLSRITGGVEFAQSIQEEIAAASEVPCLVIG